MNFVVKVTNLGINATLKEVDALVTELLDMNNAMAASRGADALNKKLLLMKAHAEGAGKAAVGLTKRIEALAEVQEIFGQQAGAQRLGERYLRARDDAKELAQELRGLITLQNQLNKNPAGLRPTKGMTPGELQNLTASGEAARLIQGSGILQRMRTDGAVSSVAKRSAQLGKEYAAQLANNVKGATNAAHAFDLLADSKFSKGLQAEGEAARQSAVEMRAYADSLTKMGGQQAAAVASIRLPSALGAGALATGLARSSMSDGIVKANTKGDLAAVTVSLGRHAEALNLVGETTVLAAREEGALAKAEGETAQSADLAAQAFTRLAQSKDLNGLTAEAAAVRATAKAYAEYARDLRAGAASAALPAVAGGAGQLAAAANAKAMLDAKNAYKPGVTTQSQFEIQSLNGVSAALRNEAVAADGAAKAEENRNGILRVSQGLNTATAESLNRNVTRDKAANSELTTTMKNTSKVALDTEKALGNLANLREQEGMTGFATKLRGLETEMRNYREQVDAAMKAGDAFGASQIARPAVMGGGLQQVNLTRATEKAVSGITNEYGKAIISVELFNTASEKNLRTIEEQIAATKERMRVQKEADEAAIRAEEVRTQQQAIYNQYLFEEERARSRAALAQGRLIGASAGMTKTMGNFYPLIVSAGLWTGLAAKLKAFSGAAIQTSADYEKAFADVARTTNVEGGNTEAKLGKIHQQLLDLSTQVPVSFPDLSKIATLGNQLGIEGDNIADFSKNVAQFSAVTNESTDETAKSFGSITQILHLNKDEYKDLGSSITLVGRKSIATEAEVLKMTNRIGSTLTQAKFTKTEVVGLAGALASLKEPPERSQGGLENFFKVVSNAAAEGGDKLENFGRVAGMSGAKVKQMLDNGEAFKFFRTFLTGLEKIKKNDGFTAQNKALSDLGLKNSRVSEVLRRLADNLAYVDKTQAYAAVGFKDGSDLADQYGIKTATLASQFVILQNNISNFFNAIGSSGPTATLTVIVTLLGKMVSGVTHFLSVNKGFASTILALSLLATAFAVVKAITVATTLATFALDVAQSRIGANAFFGSIGKMITLMTGLPTATDRATASLVRMGVVAKEAGGTFAITGKAALALADQMVKMGLATSDAAALATLGVNAEGAALGMTKASVAATILAQRLVDLGIVRDVSAGLVLLGEAGVISAKGELIGAGGATVLTGALTRLGGAILGVVSKIPGLFLLIYVGSLFTDFNGTVEGTFNVLANIGVALDNTAAGIWGFIADMKTALASMSPMGGVAYTNFMKEAQDARERAKQFLDDAKTAHSAANQISTAIEKWAGSYKKKSKATADDKKANAEYEKELARLKKLFGDVNAELPKATDNTKKHAAATKAAAKEVRTFADYASDLGTVMQRALDIQFGPGIGFDATTNAFDDMKKNADDARKAIKDAQAQVAQLNAELHKLQADNRQQQYFKTVAMAFGDLSGADAIQANIDKNNADIATNRNSKNDQQKTIDENTAKLDRTTTGNSKAARDNRAALYDLVNKYQDYITKLAASGISQKELNKKVGEARSRFVDQGVAMGYSTTQLKPYTNAMKGFRTIVDTMPRNITVSVDARFPARSALSEFWAREKQKARDSVGDINNILDGVGKTPSGKPLKIAPVEFPKPKGIQNARISADLVQLNALTAALQAAKNERKGYAIINGLSIKLERLEAKLAADQKSTGRFSSGGYTGAGGKYVPAGTVHRGEYVVPAQYVNQQTGLPYADFLGKLVRGTRTTSYAGGGYVDDTGAKVIELGPQSMKVLKQFVTRELEAHINPGDLAGTTSAYRANQRRRGQG